MVLKVLVQGYYNKKNLKILREPNFSEPNLSEPDFCEQDSHVNSIEFSQNENSIEILFEGVQLPKNLGAVPGTSRKTLR